jgi:hypothetical protein
MTRLLTLASVGGGGGGVRRDNGVGHCIHQRGGGVIFYLDQILLHMLQPQGETQSDLAFRMSFSKTILLCMLLF